MAGDLRFWGDLYVCLELHSLRLILLCCNYCVQKNKKVSPFTSHLQQRSFNSYPFASIPKRRPVPVDITFLLQKIIYVSGIRICVYLRTTTRYATNHFFAGKRSILEKKRAKLVEEAGLLDFQGASGRTPQLEDVINLSLIAVPQVLVLHILQCLISGRLTGFPPLWCYLLRLSTWQRYYNPVSLLSIANQFWRGHSACHWH